MSNIQLVRLSRLSEPEPEPESVPVPVPVPVMKNILTDLKSLCLQRALQYRYYCAGPAAKFRGRLTKSPSILQAQPSHLLDCSLLIGGQIIREMYKESRAQRG
jgi:hypothetical protein